MFTPLDPDTLLVIWRPPGPEVERALIGRDGKPRPHHAPDLPSAFLTPWDGEGPEPAWTTAKPYIDDLVLSDPAGGYSHIVPLDRAALGLGDPDTLEITGAAPIPGTTEVVITRHGSGEVATWNYRTLRSELLTLEGEGGADPVGVIDGVLWLTNYNTLCRFDGPRTVRCSKSLQGPFHMPGYSVPAPTGYIGKPFWCAKRGGFLIPRPHSGDIVLVPPDTLEPTHRIVTGGRPFALHVFEDGAIVIIDDTLGRFQTAKLKDLRDF